MATYRKYSKKLKFEGKCFIDSSRIASGSAKRRKRDKLIYDKTKQKELI
jgi:hypothetical protein